MSRVCIPNDQGIKACIDMSNKDTEPDDHTDEILTEMLSLILPQDFLEFNNEHV